MIFVLSKGKFPKKPQENNFLEICRKDFKELKKAGMNPLLEYISSLVLEIDKKDKKRDNIEKQKQDVKSIAKLIEEGKDKIAFSLLYRTFPYCLPHRNR
jgi:hypothetical protein